MPEPLRLRELLGRLTEAEIRFVLVGGLAVTFYFPHRRLRGIVSATPAGSAALLAPIARRDWSAKRVFTQVIATVGQRLGSEPEVTVNEQALPAT